MPPQCVCNRYQRLPDCPTGEIGAPSRLLELLLSVFRPLWKASGLLTWGIVKIPSSFPLHMSIVKSL
jgi:hypothetical protein